MLAFALALSASPALQEELACDRSAIEWVLPGDFETARRRAVDERRMLLVKGISFGVDAAGAKCATEGTW